MTMRLDNEVVYDKQGLMKIEHKVLTDGWTEIVLRGDNNYYVPISPKEAREIAGVLLRSADEVEHRQKAWHKMQHRQKAGE